MRSRLKSEQLESTRLPGIKLARNLKTPSCPLAATRKCRNPPATRACAALCQRLLMWRGRLPVSGRSPELRRLNASTVLSRWLSGVVPGFWRSLYANLGGPMPQRHLCIRFYQSQGS